MPAPDFATSRKRILGGSVMIEVRLHLQLLWFFLFQNHNLKLLQYFVFGPWQCALQNALWLHRLPGVAGGFGGRSDSHGIPSIEANMQLFP